jgi:hypothetical protein
MSADEYRIRSALAPVIEVLISSESRRIPGVLIYRSSRPDDAYPTGHVT